MSDDSAKTAAELQNEMLQRVRRYQRHPLSKRLMLKSFSENQLYEVVFFLQSFRTIRDK